MTREEAIEILQGAIKKPNTKDGYLGQALDMAIKAIEQEPCEDKLAIERYQDLVDYFSNKDIAKTILGDREEFKKWLDRMKWNVRRVDELERKLEQEPCKDAVSRAEVLKGYVEVGMADGLEIYSTKAVPIEYIKNLPSVTPARKEWIPVSERPPKEGEKILMNTVHFGEITGVYDSELGFMTHYSLSSADMASVEVIAWMPSPEPYKEGVKDV